MMHFKEKYLLFSKQFDAYKKRIDLKEENLQIENHTFCSDFNVEFNDTHYSDGDLFFHEITRQSFPENREFSYPVFKLPGDKAYSNGIIMLHGLNEKSWNKYFVWAGYLVKTTGKPVKLDVIDFPYDYTHEQPFPVNDEKIQKLVDRCFHVVFSKAAHFFA
ncbi:MAG: DUF6051 family protein [Prolixibacteraceae bacterium]|nr:DUF6051 family protein [Prolixibacteraceae bacterium]